MIIINNMPYPFMIPNNYNYNFGSKLQELEKNITILEIRINNLEKLIDSINNNLGNNNEFAKEKEPGIYMI